MSLDPFFDVPNPPVRMGVLDEASELVHGPRAVTYGPPSENFDRWSKICAAMGIPLSPQQLALVLVAGKLARNANMPKRDNIVDAAGYLEIYGMLEPAVAPSQGS